MAEIIFASVTKDGTKSQTILSTDKQTPTLEKLFEGVADYDKTFELINRGYAPDTFKAGQWFELQSPEYYYFLEVLPPLDFRANAFSMSEFSTGNLTNAFLKLCNRFFCITISRTCAADFDVQIADLAKAINAEPLS